MARVRPSATSSSRPTTFRERTSTSPSRSCRPGEYLKGAKREQRVHKATGTPYFYVEGSIPYPDRTDGPSRTILTAEGGATPSRFKHLIRDRGRPLPPAHAA